MVTGASVGLHVAALGLLALHRDDPTPLPVPPVMEVSIVPAYIVRPQAPPAAVANRPIQPRQAARPLDEDRTVAPLRLPPAPSPVLPPAPPPAVNAQVRNALRGGAVGCANPSLLSRDERVACEEKLGRGAKNAPFYEPPMDADKRSAFAAAAARKEAYRKYKEGNVPPGTGVGDGLTGGGPQMKALPEVWTHRR